MPESDGGSGELGDLVDRPELPTDVPRIVTIHYEYLESGYMLLLAKKHQNESTNIETISSDAS